MPDNSTPLVKKDNRLDAIKNKIEGPIPGQTLSEYLNRTNVTPVVKKCLMDKEFRVMHNQMFSRTH